MEDSNLIELCSPNDTVSVVSPKKTSPSADNNPFDLLWNLANSNVGQDTEVPPLQLIDTSFRELDNMFYSNSGRESFSFNLNGMDEFPRESLGILNMDSINLSIDDFNFDSLKNSFKALTDSNLLDTAFLCCSPYLSTFSPNVSDLQSSSLTFDTPELSRIYSIGSSLFTRTFDTISITSNALNEAFIKTIETSLLTNQSENRLRLLSLPVWGAVKEQTYSLLSKSENNELTSKIAEPHGDEDDSFNDSVFIEANHFASKLADGSITSTACFEENLLDFTSPPELEEDADSSEPPLTAPNNEEIFKCIDKMIAPHPDTNSVEESSNVEQNSLELKQNICKIFERKCSSRHSSTARDASELLHNLSEIINNENRDFQQNLEGQKLLFGLADILCSKIPLNQPTDNTNRGIDDCGYSSFVHDEQKTETDCHSNNVLDLHVYSKSTGEEPLDLSLKTKQLSHSLTSSSQKATPLTFINGTKLTTPNVGYDKFNNITEVKLKPKRSESIVVSKKGPLKAVIPVGNMSKHQGSRLPLVSTTPPKMENGHTNPFKIKRTSTPIMESKLKPVAQSTPDGPNSELESTRSPCNLPRALIKPKLHNASSELSKSNNSGSTNTSLNKSKSIGPSVQSATLTRRHSESELKSNKQPAALKRAYSIGKSNNIQTAPTTNKAVLKNTTDAGSQYAKPNVLKNKNYGLVSNLKPYNQITKSKKTKIGKENIK